MAEREKFSSDSESFSSHRKDILEKIENLVVEEVSFGSIPVELREKVLQKIEVTDDTVLVSTCARVCAVYDSGKHENKISFDGKSIRYGWDAFEYLVKITAGLETIVPGETHIVKQMKDAFLSSHLRGVFDLVLSIAKKTRNRFPIKPVTMSTCISFILSKIFDDLSEKNLLLLGTGQIAQEIKPILKKFSRAFVWSRNFENSERFCEEAGAGEPIESFNEYIKVSDVVVTATGSPNFLVTPENTKDRKGVTVFIDLSVPRNISPEVAKKDEFFLFNIDDIGKVSRMLSKEYDDLIRQAKDFVKEQVELLEAKLKRDRAKRVVVYHIKGNIVRILKEQGMDDRRAQVTADKIIKKLMAPLSEFKGTKKHLTPEDVLRIIRSSVETQKFV